MSVVRHHRYYTLAENNNYIVRFMIMKNTICKLEPIISILITILFKKGIPCPQIRILISVSGPDNEWEYLPPLG